MKDKKKKQAKTKVLNSKQVGREAGKDVGRSLKQVVHRQAGR